MVYVSNLSNDYDSADHTCNDRVSVIWNRIRLPLIL